MKMAFASLLLFLAACATSSPPKTVAADIPTPQTLDEAANSEYRTTDNKLRDRYRHPVDTLNFFGLKPGMTVVEITPGSGWYQQIIAPLLAKNGHYIEATTKSAHGHEDVDAWMKAHPDIAATIAHTNFNPPDAAHIAPDGTVDMVVTFRNVHNWMSKKGEKAAFDAFFKALKPGGILGLEEHRADPKKKSNSDSGYVKESEVIKLATKAGFKLVAKSEINANPNDTKDYKEGVWTLPPVNKHPAEENAKYLAIGESDRMTLKFVKPAH
jgi:predicted methyltransferase